MKVAVTVRGREEGGERARMREILHSLAQSPNGCTYQGWARPNLGTRNFIWASHMGTGVHTLGLSSTDFLGTLAFGWVRSGTAAF